MDIKPRCTVRCFPPRFALLKDVYIDDNTSETAKQHAREILAAAGIDVEPASEAERDEHEVRVLAGYKAALHSEYT